jgi:hypothetical protein
MAATREYQTKFQYEVTLDLGNGTVLGILSPDEITMPEIKRDVLKRFNNKLNEEIKIYGRETYGDMVLKGALEIVETGSVSSIAAAISALQDMVDSDYDTVDVTIHQLDRTSGATYRTAAYRCLLMSIKLDDLNRQNGDDAMAKVTITLTPGKVAKLAGPQMG